MKQEINKIKYFLYARKSSESEDRQMASIDSQIDELKKLAQQNNLEIVHTFSEARSAKEPGRKIFNEMLERIRKGEAQGVLCWKLNRLARNPIDGGQISWMLQQGMIQNIQTYGRSYYPTDNVIVMAVELGMANQFIRDLSIDTKRGLRTKAERGWYPTYTTLGYIHNQLKKKGEKEVINDPERFDLVKKMFRLMLSGEYTPPKILCIANNEWSLRTKAGRKVARSTIYRIFTDTFYYGEFEFPKRSGVWYHGQHEPMITKEEFDRIQILLGRKGSYKPRTHEFSYTGLIRCAECGAMITAEEKTKHQKNGNSHSYIYYHCTKRKDVECSQKNIRKEDLEKQIDEILESIEIPPEFKEWALEALRKENSQEFESRKFIISSQQKAYNTCIQKIDALIDMRARGEITEEEFANKKSQEVAEKSRLAELMNDSDTHVANWIEKAEALFTFAETARFRFERGSIQDKRTILSSLGSNLYLNNKKLSISLSEPLLLLKGASYEAKQIRDRLEPQKIPIDKRDLANLYDQSSTMLRW